MHGHDHDHNHNRSAHASAFESDPGAALLELEGEVLSGFTAAAAEALADCIERSGVVVRRVIDLGCGPGVATCDLVALFEPARVVAADRSSAMLARAAARARRLGLAAHVDAVQVDLDGDLAMLGSCDVVYASMSLHHVRDEVATLGQLRALLEPHGLLCVLERDDPPVLRLADECGRPGIWDRLERAWRRWFEHARDDLPGATRAEMYPAMLAAAGFDVIVDQIVDVCVDLSGDRAASRFAARQLGRAPVDLAPYADAADLEAVPDLVRRMSDLTDGLDGTISASRKLLIAAPRSAR